MVAPVHRVACMRRTLDAASIGAAKGNDHNLRHDVLDASCRGSFVSVGRTSPPCKANPVSSTGRHHGHLVLTTDLKILVFCSPNLYHLMPQR